MMRKPDKPALRKALVDGSEAISLEAKSIKDCYSCVLDRGALLHRVCWVKGSNFKQVVDSDVSFVRTHYGTSYIIFDGYETQSTKSSEHIRRKGKQGKCYDVDVKEEITVPCSQEKFLSNEENKSRLIKMTSQYLQIDGNTVVTCKEDADAFISATALNLASSTKKKVAVIADDRHFCKA